jgi:AraC-like DNA-binding protein
VLLSRNYPPHPELAPYIRRHYVFAADLPEDFAIEDRLLSETAFVRVLLRGKWEAEVAPGFWASAGDAILFGGNGRPLNVRVCGPFTVAGFAIRPSAWRSLFSQSARIYTDKVVPLSAAWGEIASTMLAKMHAAKDDKGIVAAMEGAIRSQLAAIGKPRIDHEMAALEYIARTDSTVKVEHLGPLLGLSVRQVERRCLASFGLSPKQVMRRSRFLDMATALRGFSTPSEEELAALRYFDQSHLNREFRHFAGMPPGAFAKAVTPLFTAGLKLRDEGKTLT